ncbi:hypothetical protein BDV32DRAFT_158049 [Aspergillus pseudonomiae]|uniref:Uncharacterized protein n=1 Tax=Aspergillus pseudonomiae TaxID=1506151 RepID=A0A5N6IKM3_9EURO|nr:uncharacterized protein BDV37DRAFT_292923 [Aspergillus pseudonomiae]KAB8265673.1 hypothetical protein BDV32DRAFT_158049 [Aspergillus pseudonomiae]KAE8405720.1 hypothetical protein BDV37DRAFT_292923 [Aspergillus pseudonomiae]
MSETSLGANFDKQSPAYMAELSLVTQLRSVATEAEGDTRILSVPGAQVFSSDIVEPLLQPKIGISTRESKPQRSSSTVVSLDTAEVVVRKSKRLSEARARKETYTAKHTLPRSISNEPAATASQNRKLMSRHKPCTLSFNNRDKPRLSNTQESLIFHPQRAYRKVYATHRKEPVDWDEDLRPSGESELGKRNESTPVFSPASGERSAFNKRPSSGQKVIREASSSAGKRQRPPARSTGSAIKGKNSILGPISYDMMVNNATEVPRYKGGLKTFEGIDIRTEDHSSSSGSEDLVSGKCATDDSTSIEASAKGVTSLLEIEEHRQRASEPTPALHSGDNNADETHSYVTDAKDSGPSQAPPKPQLLGAKHLGRGRGIGGKLAAAFQLEEISSQWNRSHSHGHDASPDRKSQSNPETTMPSIQSMEEAPRNKLLVESNLARTCEDNDGDCVISRSSDTDRSLNRFMDQNRPNEVQETNQNKCQGILREVEMITASIETVATELLDDGKWSATNLTQSRRHAQPRHGDTLISQSDHSSRSCIGNDEPGPGSESSGITRAATSKHSGPVSAKPLLRHDSQQVQDHTAEHQRMTPRKSIVDINGSPRLLSHMENKIIISDGTVHRESQSRQLTQDEKQVPARSIDDESGYDGGIEESFVEVPGTKSNLAHTAYGESSGMRIRSPFAQGPSLPRNREDRTRGMHRDRFRAASVPHRQHIRIDIAGQDLYQSPSQGELASIDSNWNTTVISSSRGRSLKKTKGDTTLQALQRSTQEMLLDSSESMMSWRHIAGSATACWINFSRHKKNE